MAKKNSPVDPDTLDGGQAAFVPGQWYQFAVPGGFLMFGQYVRALGGGMHRMANVKHMRNAGQVELPAMVRDGLGRNTVTTKHSWPLWQGIVLWFAPMAITLE
jgi:hypothetical protein